MNENEVYALMVNKDPQWLSRPIEDLVKMQAVGSVYLATHKELLKKIKGGQIHLAEEDRRSKLAEGQIIGEALLDVEVKIGQMLPSAEEARKVGRPGHFGGVSGMPEGYKKKDKNGGNKAMNARALANNPELVEQIKQEARDNEDIPTKTAVLNKIKLKKAQDNLEREKASHAKAVAEGRTQKMALEIKLEEQLYITSLEKFLMIVPKTPPKDWTDEGFKKARALANLIIKRLEVFNG